MYFFNFTYLIKYLYVITVVFVQRDLILMNMNLTKKYKII